MSPDPNFEAPKFIHDHPFLFLLSDNSPCIEYSIRSIQIICTNAKSGKLRAKILDPHLILNYFSPFEQSGKIRDMSVKISYELVKVRRLE